MASDTSGKAKLGTAIALIGGAVGTGIIIYALMGGQVSAPLIAEKTPEGSAPEATPTTSASVTPSEQVEGETSQTAETTDTPSNTNTGADVETASGDTDDSDTATGEPQDTASAADREPTETPAAEDAESESPETTQEEDQTEPEDPQTEVASVAQPDPISPTEPTSQSEANPATPSDAPIVETDDPIMPGSEPVVLQAAPAPSGQGPALDPSDPAVPKFDLVRIEADGSAVIAGRASPNAEVQILSNGEEIGTAKASSRGEFVALIDTEISSTAQSLALVADGPDTGRVQSQSNVIVLARSATEIDNLDEEISLAPAIVQATPDAVRVIQPVVGLADLDRVSLDTISYDDAGQVILAGRGRPGYTARIYASGKSISDSKISGSGTWSATINDLDEGRYVIRVDELNPQGDVASRVESPFQRIFPTAEQLALLTDATSVIVQPGNNLWTIAEGRYGEGFRYTTIFEANKEQIRDPDLIYPGQVFELPEGAAE